MESIFINEVRAIVADTYLSYTCDIDGSVAFERFVSRSPPLLDVRRDPKFASFTDEELTDEMMLMEHDIKILFNQHLHLNSSQHKLI